MPSLVTELDVPGLGPSVVEQLKQAGYTTAEQLAELGARDLCGAISLDPALARALVLAARQRVEPAGAQVVSLANDPADTATSDPTRGLKLARRLERSADLLRQAHVRVMTSESKGRKKTLARIERVLTVLHAIEHDVIALGATRPFGADLRALLAEHDDHVGALVDRNKPPRKRHLKRLRHELDDIRRRLESLL